jgi:hypothetical protein
MEECEKDEANDLVGRIGFGWLEVGGVKITELRRDFLGKMEREESGAIN